MEFVAAADEVVDLVRLAGDGLKLGVELADHVLEADELGAELFEESCAVGEGEASIALGEQREEKLRALADAGGKLQADRWRRAFFSRMVISRSRRRSSTLRFETVMPK